MKVSLRILAHTWCFTIVELLIKANSVKQSYHHALLFIAALF